MILNKYSIFWVTLLPLEGNVTLKDLRKIPVTAFWDNSEISFHNGSKQYAIDRINALRGKLSKKYLAVMYTDKQFGLRKYNMPVNSILTKMQKQNTIEI